MTRDDVANLVLRTFALWLGVWSVMAIGMCVTPPPGVGHAELLLFSALPFGAAVGLWLAAGRLTRAMFARPDAAVPFTLSSRGIPALASFVVGLMTIAGAVPDAISWVSAEVIRRTMTGSVFDSPLGPATDPRSAGAAVEVVARIAVGIALLALSRRPDFWPLPDDTTRTASGDAPVG